MKFIVRSFLGLALCGALAAAAAAQAETFPNRPVKLVVAFAPGGNNDVPVRIVATKLSDLWGVPVTVENRAGAGGILGSEFVARASADGYTLLNCNSATHGVNPALHKKLPYDPVRQFAAVSLIGSAPNVLIVPASSPLRSVQDFLAQARANPGKLAVGTAGIGTTQHFSLELLKSATGTDMVHVPYKGGSLALTDVLGGQVPAAITGLPTALQAIRAGKVRALAVTAGNRSKHLPDLPTLTESGVTGYEVTTWTGICAPAGTPRAIIDKANDDIRKVLAMPDTRQQLLDAGVEPSLVSVEWLSELIASEVAKFSRLVAAAGIPIDQ